MHEPPHGLSAAQAGRSTQAAEQSQPWLHATQQDQEYQQAEKAIPQLGGPMLGDFADQCHANVELMRNSLTRKLEEHMVEYLECNSCYNGYVWEDSM